MLRKRFQAFDPIVLVTFILVALAILALAITFTAPARGADGGIGAGGGGGTGGKVEKARLVDGKAIAPDSAPARVKRAIRYANKIRKTPYKWGGGHADWESKGYDCSGAVSYALHGARMLKAPMDSSGLMSWGRRGKGRWITVYANSGHTWADIAGLRWDTSGGPGPRWYKDMRSSDGYKVRHYKSF